MSRRKRTGALGRLFEVPGTADEVADRFRRVCFAAAMRSSGSFRICSRCQPLPSAIRSGGQWFGLDRSPWDSPHQPPRKERSEEMGTGSESSNCLHPVSSERLIRGSGRLERAIILSESCGIQAESIVAVDQESHSSVRPVRPARPKWPADARHRSVPRTWWRKVVLHFRKFAVPAGIKLDRGRAATGAGELARSR